MNKINSSFTEKALQKSDKLWIENIDILPNCHYSDKIDEFGQIKISYDSFKKLMRREYNLGVSYGIVFGIGSVLTDEREKCQNGTPRQNLDC